MNTIDIYVRYSSGAYNTNRVGKLSSSSTSSAQNAAERQAGKLFGPAVQSVTCIDEVRDRQASVWRATADADRFAWSWATGEIEFGTEVPEDAVAFAKGPDRALRLVVQVAARHGYDGNTLLVPGVPESKNQKDGMTELLLWMNREAIRNGNPDRYGVVFGNDVARPE